MQSQIKISKDTLTSYKQNGFCVLRNAISKDILMNVLSEVDKVFTFVMEANNLKPTQFKDDQTLYKNMKALFAHDVQKYLAVVRHCAKLASLQNMTSCDTVIKIAEAFGIQYPTIPSSPVLHISSDELVIPGGYYGIESHQDWTSIQGGLDSIVMWIPFMDVGINRFPVEVIPGSHLRGVIPGKIAANSYSINPEELAEDDFRRYEVNFGDILLFSVFTVHRTGLKNCKGLRISSSTRYENSAEETFVERSYPCAYKRTVQREFITPDFPSHKQVKAVFKP